MRLILARGEMRRVHKLLAACAWLGSFGGLQAEKKPSITALRLGAAERVEVDGRLEEAAWQRAEKGKGFRQYDPGRGTPATERTEFAMVYDRDHLYVGVWCYDSEPGVVMARSMRRDRIFTGSDFVYLFFDTFHDQRNGYVFAVNPTGAQSDGLITNNTGMNFSWDGIWMSKARITDEGWFVELAIPFKTVSFDPDGTVWGFNMSRRIRRKNEAIRWTGWKDEIKSHYASEAGDITGLRGMRQGLGLEFSPYAVGRHESRKGEGDSLGGDLGADLRYRVTPSFSATVSYNTDFAETEVDQRVVNFTRFPLFFPEKRDFFLEDSGIYDFGPGFQRRGRGPTFLPYFTRRIGLADGRIVPTQLATKLAGRLGDYDVGFTHARLEGPPGLNEQNVFATRVTKQVFSQSRVGVIATGGDPNSNRDNYVGGVDFTFRTNEFLDDKILGANLYALGNYAEAVGGGHGTDYAFGGRLSYPNDRWDGSLSYLEVGPGFDPALGFVRRTGIRTVSGLIRRKHRPGGSGWYRQLARGADVSVTSRTSGGLDSARFGVVPFNLDFASTDELSLRISHNIDRPDEAFELGDITVPAGEYSWTKARLEFEATSSRPVWGEFSVEAGEFYDGWRVQGSAEVEWNPSRHFRINGTYQYNRVDLGEGSFDAHVGSLGINWNLTPDLGWSTLVQYDSLSNEVGFNSRIRWEYRPGSTIYLVLNQALLTDDRGLDLQRSDLTLKADATFRF